ncbi:DUF402 domain-containing protein [Kitasatospora sp. NPDC101801]|uniref:DUF402 domain-containing protein n=1 Tax=Kitasatospora sp. NPDC101801 TaxID=3364103 RepID=UPI0037FBCB0B
MTTTTGLFTPGATAVRRDVHLGRVWTAMPQRVLADTGDVLTLAYWPGITSLAPTTWIDSLATGDTTLRESGLANLVSGAWSTAPYTWTGTALRSHFLAGEHFSVHQFQDHATGTRWYVNFELPHVRRPGIGIDTLDLCVDLVVEPDLSAWSWKDEDEYDQVRRLGLVDDHLHRHVERAREKAVGLLQDRSGPFAQPWSVWSPDPAWPLPVLPADAAIRSRSRSLGGSVPG